MSTAVISHILSIPNNDVRQTFLLHHHGLTFGINHEVHPLFHLIFTSFFMEVECLAKFVFQWRFTEPNSVKLNDIKT